MKSPQNQDRLLCLQRKSQFLLLPIFPQASTAALGEQGRSVCRLQAQTWGHLESPAATSSLTSSFQSYQGVAYSGTRYQDYICKGLQKYMGRIPGPCWDRQPSQPACSVGILQKQWKLKGMHRSQSSWSSVWSGR